MQKIDTTATIGTRLRQFREEVGMSIEDVAYKTNMDAEQVVHIENDEIEPSIVQSVVLAESVGVSTGKLMGVEGRVKVSDLRCSHPESELMETLVEMFEVDAMLTNYGL